MEKSLVSIIVPIFNVEAYLDRCVENLVNQTYKNLEIILVDDGSPDGCPHKCEDWARKDSRIKVIHKENGGLSDARNAGMNIATGEYISFIDSDDYVALDFCETMLLVIKKENKEHSDDLAVATFETESALSGLISENPFHQHVWNKIYKTQLVKDIPYAVGKLNEDEFWTYQVFGRAKKVSKINKTMYYYFQRSSSIMGENYSIRRLDVLEGKTNRQKYIQKEYPALALQAKIDLYNSCIFAYQNVLKFMSGEEKQIATKIVKQYSEACRPSFFEINQENTSSKKYLYLAFVNFYLCCKLRAVFGIGF